MEMCQQDVEQSAAQHKSSTEQVHIKVEPDTHYEDSPAIHGACIEPIVDIKIEPGTYDPPDKQEQSFDGSEEYLKSGVSKEVLIKEEPVDHEYYIEIEPIKAEPEDDELRDTQAKSQVFLENEDNASLQHLHMGLVEMVPSENVAEDRPDLDSHDAEQDEKPYKCDYCGKTYSVFASYKSHLRIHSGTKPYKCDTCDMGFSFASDLKDHKLGHTGEKPFKCNSCDKAFRRQGYLKIHIRSHTGEKPFECKTCGKTFKRNDHLKIHIRTHTGEKPYKCHICGKCFGRSHTLKEHIESCEASLIPAPEVVPDDTEFVYSHLFR